MSVWQVTTLGSRHEKTLKRGRHTATSVVRDDGAHAQGGTRDGATALRFRARTAARTRRRRDAPRFGKGALAYALRSRIRVTLLRSGELYRQASSALARLGIDVDAWPAPPAGLFVVEERSLYLRSRSPMTVAHEFGHALDCALGGGVYRSGIDPQVRGLFANATAFVTPYAATGVDGISPSRCARSSKRTTRRRRGRARRARVCGTPIPACTTTWSCSSPASSANACRRERDFDLASLGGTPRCSARDECRPSGPSTARLRAPLRMTRSLLRTG